MFQGMCSGSLRVSCSYSYSYHRATQFLQSARAKCLTIFCRTHSSSLTISSLSFSLRDVDVLCCPALLCGWSGYRGSEEWVCAMLLMDTVCRLQLLSIITVLFWTLINWCSPLVRDWSFVYVYFDMASAQMSGSVCNLGLFVRIQDAGVKKGNSRVRQSKASFWIDWDLRILASILAHNATICFCKNFCIDCAEWSSVAFGALSIVTLRRDRSERFQGSTCYTAKCWVCGALSYCSLKWEVS